MREDVSTRVPRAIARAPWAAAWGLGLAAALPAAAQIPQPEGGEFRVEYHTSVYGHDYPSVATEPDGDFVVVWQSYASSPGNDNSATSIQGRRFASDGTALGAFQVNTTHGIPARLSSRSRTTTRS
jgi:hypothetical protein